jgi:bla regulator protein blaR1
MTANAFAGEIRFSQRPRMRVAGSVALVSSVVLGLANVTLTAQATTGETPSANSRTAPAWQVAAGRHMEFEVASIHPAELGTFVYPNIPLNNEDTPVPPGGQFVADFPLLIFIEFAYRIMPTHEQEEAMLAHLPKWVVADHFVIRAQFDGNPSKDQIRLMMQSLLADRFKLAVHFEGRDVPVFALVLDRPGKPGPHIRLHAEGSPCDEVLAVPADRTSSLVPPGEFVPVCGVVQLIDGPNHTVLVGARNIAFDHIAAYLSDFEGQGRPIVDQTGLSGTFDFSLNWLPERIRLLPAASAPPDAQGPSLLEALKDQLGLKLRPTHALVQTLVIDHVEQPSPN